MVVKSAETRSWSWLRMSGGRLSCSHALGYFTMKILPPAQLVHAVTWGLTRTLRFHLFGTEHVRTAARLSPTGTFVACHWHQSLLLVLGPHHHLPVATLASRSSDGQIIARYLEAIGISVVRGSSSRGGAHAARELMMTLRDGKHIVLSLDGPRGPFKRVKDGAMEIARRCGVPLVPVVARGTRELSFKRSWDCFRVPLPLSHVAVVYGEPIIYPPGDPDPAELDRRRRDLAWRMHRLEAQASKLAGRADAWPLAPDLAWLGAAGETAGLPP